MLCSVRTVKFDGPISLIESLLSVSRVVLLPCQYILAITWLGHNSSHQISNFSNGRALGDAHWSVNTQKEYDHTQH
jgi:hypothetical protein